MHGGYLNTRQLSARIGQATSVQELDEYVSEHRDAMDEIHVSAALCSLVKLPDGLRKPWLLDCLAQMLLQPQPRSGVARIELLIPRNLSASFWALAKGGRADSAAFRWLKARLCDGRVLATCNAQDLANILWACATVDGMDAAFAELLCEAVLALGPHTFTPQALSNILRACATAGHVDPALIQAVCREAVRTDLRGWSVQSLVNTAWAVATLAAGSPAVGVRMPGWRTVHTMLRRLACRAAALLREHAWQPLEVSQLVWALASLDLYDAALLDATADWVMAGSMANATPQGWSNLLGGYATLRYGAPALFSASVPLMAPSLPRFSPRNLSQVMLAYAGAAPPHALAELLTLLEDAFVGALPSADPQSIANAAWALAVAIGAKRRPGRAIERLARAVVSEAEARGTGEFNSTALQQLYQLYCELSAYGQACSVLDESPVSDLNSAAAAAWQQSVGTCLPSPLAVKIHRLMLRMGWDATLEQRSPCNTCSVDIEVTVRGVRVAWEVDGRLHYMRNDCDAPNGATQLRDRRLSRSYGRPPVIINFVKEEWCGTSSKAWRQLLLRLTPTL